MKKMVALSLGLLLAATTVQAADKLETQEQKVGYALGMNIGANMKRQNLELDPEQVAAGLVAAYKGGKTLLTEEEMAAVLTAFQQQMQQKMQEQQAKLSAENLDKAKAYLAENGKKEGVVTTESGLQYKVLSSGAGNSPTAESTVKVHYRGTLIDGTQFDSSYDRGEPAEFPVTGVIPGWTEALQLMKVGDKWQLVIPPELAYAERGAPPVIPPNAALVFEVELLEVR